jgi:photosystem II stability/assembly factor-like uncharacterized protein
MSNFRFRRIFTAMLSLIIAISYLFAIAAQAQTRRPQGKLQRQQRTIKAKAHPRRSPRDLIALRKHVQAQMPRREEEEEGNDAKFKEDPEGRRNWFVFERTYPFDELPAEARRAAWDEIASELNTNQLLATEAAVPTWRAIGPRPTYSAFPNNWGRTSGRINSIAVSPADPNIVLVGAATGGVWRSTDGGETFDPVSDNQVDLAVGHIAFAPSNPNIVYAGMGDIDSPGYLGTGVLKSTDAGKTWQRISNDTLPAPGFIMRLEVDPTDPNRVYVVQFARLASNNALTSSGFYFSTDGGVNWRRTLMGLPRDLVLSPANAKTIYVGIVRVDQTGNPSPGVYRSTDGGETWSIVYTSPFPLATSEVRVTVTPAAPNSVYVYTGGGNAAGFLEIRLAASKDSGATWDSKIITSKIDPQQFTYNNFLAVDPQNANTMYVGSRDIYKTTDGGETWVNLNNNFTLQNQYFPTRSNAHPDQQSFTFIPGQANAFFVGNDGGLYKSTDAGRTFTHKNQTLGLSQIVGLDISPFDPTATLIGTQDNGTQLRFDDGNWYEISSGDGGATVFSPRNPNVFFTSYIYGSITRFDLGLQRAFNVGSQRIFGDFSTGAPRINFYPPIKSTRDGRLYFGSWRLFISRNNGDTWFTPGWAVDLTRSPTDRINAIGVSDTNSDVIYTGSSLGRVMVTRDSGESWTDITAGLPNRVIKSITTDPANPAIAYLTVSGYASAHVFKTTNYGANWSNISGNLPDIPTSAFAFDPLTRGVIYVGTDIGVFRSTNDGRTWEVFNQGLPPVIVTALATHSSGILQAATYGRGVYEINLRTNLTDSQAPSNTHKEKQQ